MTKATKISLTIAAIILLWRRAFGSGSGDTGSPGQSGSTDNSGSSGSSSGGGSGTGGTGEYTPAGSVPDSVKKWLDLAEISSSLNSSVKVADILAIIWQESNGKPEARGLADERGLMQILPSTARLYGLDIESLWDPAYNVGAGAAILQDCYDHVWKWVQKNYPDGITPLVGLRYQCYNAGSDDIGDNVKGYRYRLEVDSKFNAVQSWLISIGYFNSI